MPFKHTRPGSRFYVLTMDYRDRQFTFIAEYIKFNYLKEFWHIHANEDLLEISYHVQTHEVRQDFVFRSKVMPDDFMAALQKELMDRNK